MDTHRIPFGLTFDDVLLVPQESSISPREADVSSYAARGLALRIPLLSAAMDTVSGPALVRALAEAGGVGVLHRNCTVAEQVAMVREVKKARKQESKKAIIVAAAVGPTDLERARALDKAGADAIVFDSAHIHKPVSVAAAPALKRRIKAKLIVGNMATAAAARAFVRFADGFKVGIGPGSICTTRIVAGVGVPQIAAIQGVAKALQGTGVPLIADGEIELYQGRSYKSYRGMGSLSAMQQGSSDRYFQEGEANQDKLVPEGVEGRVPYKGSVLAVIHQLMGGLRSSMGYLGCADIATMHTKAEFVEITSAGIRESHVHDVQITKEAPNYHID